MSESLVSSRVFSIEDLLGSLAGGRMSVDMMAAGWRLLRRRSDGNVFN